MFISWVDIVLDFDKNQFIIDFMKQEIYDTVKSVIESLGLTIYHIEFNRNVLRVLVEANEAPVTVEICANAARILSAKLDLINLISCRYYLEVSSPGIERHLYKPEHYNRYKGEVCRLSTKCGSFIGKIIDADQAVVELEQVNGSSFPAGLNYSEANRRIKIPYPEIKSGQLKIADDLLFGKNHRSEAVGKEK